jgi:hypothetical protein
MSAKDPVGPLSGREAVRAASFSNANELLANALLANAVVRIDTR